MKRIRLVILLVTLCLLIPPLSTAKADIVPEPEKGKEWREELFQKYWDMREGAPAKKPSPQWKQSDLPGWIVEGWDRPPTELFSEKWPYRSVTYEMYFPSKKPLARAIYGLALFTKDLKPSVTLARFEKGAGGFHYSTEQLVGWANAVGEGRQKFYTSEEKAFLEKLVQDKVMVKVNGRFRQIGMIRHVLGVAPMKKRSMVLNLKHERLHVMWDENQKFRETYISRWRGLTDEEKQEVYKQLKGYNPEKEMQIIEEWSVRHAEKQPKWY